MPPELWQMGPSIIRQSEFCGKTSATFFSGGHHTEVLSHSPPLFSQRDASGVAVFGVTVFGVAVFIAAVFGAAVFGAAVFGAPDMGGGWHQAHRVSHGGATVTEVGLSSAGRRLALLSRLAAGVRGAAATAEAGAGLGRLGGSIVSNVAVDVGHSPTGATFAQAPLNRLHTHNFKKIVIFPLFCVILGRRISSQTMFFQNPRGKIEVLPLGYGKVEKIAVLVKNHHAPPILVKNGPIWAKMHFF